MSKLATHNQNK